MMTSLLLQPARDPVALQGDPIQQWVQPDGSAWAVCHRSASGYVIRFPEYADFEISSDASAIVCHPFAASEQHTIEHLYRNHVLPMALGRQGSLTFHGSAIEFASRAVVFMGESGRGKSTLAFSFAINGFRFLADDGLVIDDGPDEISVLPNHPSIRLWHDSKQAMAPDDAGVAEALPYTAKSRIEAGGEIAFCDQSRPLSVVYFLGQGQVDDFEVRAIKPADALIKWVTHSFMLDVEDKDRVAMHFERVGRLVAKVPCYNLDYARRFDELKCVRQSIVEHLREACAGSEIEIE